MALERGYTMVQIREEARDLLRELAHHRRKPMYEVLEEVLREAWQRDTEHTAQHVHIRVREIVQADL
jgi:hypothetical protein